MIAYYNLVILKKSKKTQQKTVTPTRSLLVAMLPYEYVQHYRKGLDPSLLLWSNVFLYNSNISEIEECTEPS